VEEFADLTEYQKFTQNSQNLKTKYRQDSNLSDLYEQTSKLTELYKNLEKTIEKKFTLLIEGGPSAPSILESIKSDIQIPEIISIDGTDEIPEFISYLDSLFKEWGSNEEKSVKL